MADRQRFCVIILSLMILGSGCYLGYFIFIDSGKQIINKFNWVRLCIFFIQHIITLVMFVKLLFHEEAENAIQWMFQLSFLITFTFIGGEVFTVARGGRIVGSSFFIFQSSDIDKQNPILEFESNQITFYYQIMTDFIMFFIVSGVALIVMKCRSLEQENKYEFMIDNLKSQDYVDEPNVHDKKTCSICLTDLANQRVLKVPCQHIFHKECLINWLKRSTVCPLCRTDIEQSLGPNSPLRYPGQNSSPFNNPHSRTINDQPQQLQQPQQLPELTFHNNNNIIRNNNRLNSVSAGIRSNRGHFTDRVNQQVVSNANSRVSIGRTVRQRQRQRNTFTQRDNQRQQSNQFNYNPHFGGNDANIPHYHHQQRHTQNNRLKSSIQQDNYPLQKHNIMNHSGKMINSPSSVQSYTPRSIFLPPPPQSQNKITPRNHQTTNSLSQPQINLPKQQQKHQQVFGSSQQQIQSPESKIYPNPNQKFVRNVTFKLNKQSQNQQFSDNYCRINQMVRNQIIS